MLPRVSTDVGYGGPVGVSSRLQFVAATLGQSVRSYGVSRNGILVIRRGLGGSSGSRDLVVTNRTGAAVLTRTQRGLYRSARFSPDGQRLLFSQAVTATAGGDIFMLSLADNGLVRLTSDSANLAPEWSPDGQSILWREDVGPNTRDILSASFARTDSVRSERATRFGERGIALSPDGGGSS